MTVPLIIFTSCNLNMNWLQLIDSEAGHLAWPSVVLLVLVVVRQHLGTLAKRILELSFGGTLESRPTPIKRCGDHRCVTCAEDHRICQQRDFIISTVTVTGSSEVLQQLTSLLEGSRNSLLPFAAMPAIFGAIQAVEAILKDIGEHRANYENNHFIPLALGGVNICANSSTRISRPIRALSRLPKLRFGDRKRRIGRNLRARARQISLHNVKMTISSYRESAYRHCVAVRLNAAITSTPFIGGATPVRVSARGHCKTVNVTARHRLVATIGRAGRN